MDKANKIKKIIIKKKRKKNNRVRIEMAPPIYNINYDNYNSEERGMEDYSTLDVILELMITPLLICLIVAMIIQTIVRIYL